MKKILVVVDVQKDFYHPDGALYVKGGEVLPERIAKVIPQFDGVIFTTDWHPFNHCSFKEQGGMWPIHCVHHTEGSSLPKEFAPFITNNIVRKGKFEDREEYGADSEKIMYNIENTITLNCEYELVFCGIAGDYCIRETINNMLVYMAYMKTKPYKSNLPSKISVWFDGVASIDDGTTIKEFMKDNNIEEWQPVE